MNMIIRNERNCFMDHIRGISFKVPQQKPDLLPTILNGIGAEAFCWHHIMDQNEAWTLPNRGDFLTESCYEGSAFLSAISEPHFVIFLKLQAHPANGAFAELHNYEDFLKSDCAVLLLICDCEFVEIYLKDAALLNRIRENAENAGFGGITILTDENDARTKLDVLSG